MDELGDVLFGILIVARLHVAEMGPLSARGIRIDDDASSKRFSNVDRTFDSMMSIAAEETSKGLKAASSVNEVPKIMMRGVSLK
jgi:hypothetical protein